MSDPAVFSRRYVPRIEGCSKKERAELAAVRIEESFRFGLEDQALKEVSDRLPRSDVNEHEERIECL